MASRPLAVAILGVNYAPERSGIAPYTTGIARGLQNLGHEVRVLTSFPHYPEWRGHEGRPVRAQAEQMHGLPVTRLRHYVPKHPSGVRRVFFEATFGARLVAARWGQPDVVLVVSPALISSAMAITRARRWSGRPAIGLVIQDLYSRGVHEVGLGGGRFASIAASLEARVAGSVDGVAVIHDRFRQQAVRKLGVPDERVRVIRNWTHVRTVEDFDIPGFRAALGWKDDELVVLHAGAIGAKQGLSNVIEAARIASDRGDVVRFVMLGDGSRRESLEASAVGLGTVQFMDHLDDVDFGRALRAADVLLVNEKPGVREMAVPSKLTSYFSSGRPVLAATDSGSTTAMEMAASGGGVRVDPGAPLELLNAAIELGQDRSRARALGENGRRYCAEVLSEETAIKQYDDWVRELAARRRRTQDEEYV